MTTNAPSPPRREREAQLEAELRELREERCTSEELERLNAELSQQALHLREVNQTLLESEQRLRLAIETGRIGLWVWNSTDLGGSGDWSQRMKEIFGLPLDADVTHDMFLKCVHPDDRTRVDDAVMQALSGANGGEYRTEYRTMHPRDGSERWVTARGQAFFDSAGRAARFIGTVMDITERKRAEEASSRLNAELEQRIVERTADLAESAEALRISEHLARGQLAALTRTLDAIAQESSPEKLLEHVLRTIAERLKGQSVSIYERNAVDNMEMVATFEDDQLQMPSKGMPPGKRITLFTRGHPVWTEVLRTRLDIVIGELDRDPPRIRLWGGEGSPWVPVARRRASRRRYAGDLSAAVGDGGRGHGDGPHACQRRAGRLYRDSLEEQMHLSNDRAGAGARAGPPGDARHSPHAALPAEPRGGPSPRSGAGWRATSTTRSRKGSQG